MIYDIAIIGAGVSGASIARELSRYNLKVILIDKEADVSFGVSKANSGIIHGGFHSSSKYLKSRLEVKGNKMFTKLHQELNFPFKRCGIIVAAFSEEDLKTVQTLYQQGKDNGVSDIELCSRDRILELEPKLNDDVMGGLHAPSGGVIEPYRFAFALVESAKKNGVELELNFEVSKATFSSDHYDIHSSQGKIIKSKYVINAAGVYADKISKIFKGEEFEIIPRKGEEYLLDRLSKAYPNKVIFPTPRHNTKGMLVIPTVEGTMMVGPTAIEIDDKEDKSTTSENLERVFDFAKRLVPAVSSRDIITSFAGLRPALESGDFLIQRSDLAQNFIQVAGIQSPGLTAAPAIGEYVSEIICRELSPELKKEFDPYIDKVPTMRTISHQDAENVVNHDPMFGNIICRCEKVSEGEIVEAIKRGHTTLDGIKFFTRTGMGRCQGGFCSYKIIKIIMRETGLTYDQITKNGPGSEVLKGKL